MTKTFKLLSSRFIEGFVRVILLVGSIQLKAFIITQFTPESFVFTFISINLINNLRNTFVGFSRHQCSASESRFEHLHPRVMQCPDIQCRFCSVRTRPYLFTADTYVCVVHFVGEDLPVACQGFVPAERDGGWRVRHRLQVGSGARDLDWWVGRKIKQQRLEKQLNQTL